MKKIALLCAFILSGLLATAQPIVPATPVYGSLNVYKSLWVGYAAQFTSDVTLDSNMTVTMTLTADSAHFNHLDSAYKSQIADTAYLAGVADSAKLAGVSDTAFVSGVADTAFLAGTADTSFVSGVSDTSFVSGVADTAFVSGVADTAFLAGVADTSFLSGYADSTQLSYYADTAGYAWNGFSTDTCYDSIRTSHLMACSPMLITSDDSISLVSPKTFMSGLVDIDSNVIVNGSVRSYVRFIHTEDSVSLALPNGTLTLWHQKAKSNLWMNGGAINDVKLYGATLDYNTIIGTTSGISLQDAERNVIVGSGGGPGIVTGDKNTIIGSDAVSVATTISNTTAIGYHAGRDALLGNSIFIGMETNITNNSDSGVIVIGYDVKSTDANQLHIGLRDSTGAAHGEIMQVLVMDSIGIGTYPSVWAGVPSGASGSFDITCDSIGTSKTRAVGDFNSDGTVAYLYYNSAAPRDVINSNSSVADAFNIYASGGLLTFENRLPSVGLGSDAVRTCKIKIIY